MNLYLLRHTRTALAAGVCYGRLDAELAPQSDADIGRTVARVPLDGTQESHRDLDSRAVKRGWLLNARAWSC